MAEKVDVSGSSLSSLNVSGFTALKSLDCGSSELLSSLRCTGCTALQYLRASNCALNSIDITGCPEINRLYLEGNRLTDLDLSGCTSLTDANLGSSTIAQQSTRYANAWTCGNLYYVDLVGEGFFAADADVTSTSGIYSAGNGKYFVNVSDDPYSSPEIAYCVSCKDFNSGTHEMHVKVRLIPASAICSPSLTISS